VQVGLGDVVLFLRGQKRRKQALAYPDHGESGSFCFDGNKRANGRFENPALKVNSLDFLLIP